MIYIGKHNVLTIHFIRGCLFLLLLSFSPLLIGRAKAHPIEDIDTTISISAIGGLQYNIVRFRVKPGSKVRIILSNKDDMSHNLVITQPGARLDVVNASLKLGNKGLKMSYIPKSQKVLWSIPILDPGEKQSTTFTAPKKQGVYPYVCTYPGHGFVMYGAMYVTSKEMPPIQEDPNIPPKRRGEVNENNGASHNQPAVRGSYPTNEKPPYMYRMYLPDASPAAIGVLLPHHLSYCWDAGTCRLRYAWQGGFLGNTDIWKGHHDAYGKILGTVFYRDKTAFPLQVDHPGNIPVVNFKGYRLIKKYPEFHYQIDGIDVYEFIKAKKDGTGLVRTFKIPKTDRIIWFITNPEDGVTYQSSKGKWFKGKLELMPEEAHHFTIIMTKSKRKP